MSFLTLNGWAIPVASAKEKSVEIGGRGRSFDGSYQSEIRKRKRIIECTTPPVKELLAEAIKGIVNGDGDVFPFSSDVYSDKGVAPETATSYGTVESVIPEDGSYSFLRTYFQQSHPGLTGSYSAEASPLRTGVLSISPISANLVPDSLNDCESAPTGCSVIGTATLTGDTSIFWRGTKSLKVVPVGYPSGVEIGDGAANNIDLGGSSATKNYNCTFYLYNPDTVSNTYYVKLRDETNTTDGLQVAHSVPRQSWVKISALIAIGGSACRDLRIQITSSSDTFYVDNIQVTEGLPTVRYTDASGHVSDSLQFARSSLLDGFGDFSFGVWLFKEHAYRLTGDSTILLMQAAGEGDGSIDSTVKLYYDHSASKVVFQTTDTSGTSRYLSSGVTTYDLEWFFVGISYRVNPESGEACKTLTLISESIGTSTVTDDTQHDVVLDAIQDLYFGSTSGAGSFQGLFGQACVYPFAVPAEFWEGVAATVGGYGDYEAQDVMPLPKWPRKLVGGDALSGLAGSAQLNPRYGSYTLRQPEISRALFEGRVTGVRYQRGNIDGAKSNLQIVNFVLEEV